jgi:hypothetical protein
MNGGCASRAVLVLILGLVLVAMVATVVLPPA